MTLSLETLLQIQEPNRIRQQISDFYVVDENVLMTELSTMISATDEALAEQHGEVATLIRDIRLEAGKGTGIEAFLQEYGLDTEEGITLMCLAESLLRIPDSETADAFIEDKLSSGNWGKHLNQSESFFVNASTYGLMLTGRVTRMGSGTADKPASVFGRLLDRVGEPVIRTAMNQAMKIMGKQFVLGQDIDDALANAKVDRKKNYTHSFDMLGEAALTDADAERYQAAYLNAIKALGEKKYDDNVPRPSISIKLSALHPRYEALHYDDVMTTMTARVLELAKTARALDVGINIDAEEADRLEISLDLFKCWLDADALKGWDGMGMVVQAYSKRALPVLHWLNHTANAIGLTLPVRLVKGAYWDSEIKWAQERGLSGYPVFTRKINTDVSYLACANYLLTQAKGSLFPQFATHNAQTVMSVARYAHQVDNHQYECQRLHGMGEALYDKFLQQHQDIHCRVYAPVGKHKDLLPYLVRRLLENGANTSFVHKLLDPNTEVEKLARHPLNQIKALPAFYNDALPLPSEILPRRKNSTMLNVHIESDRQRYEKGLAEANWQSVAGEKTQTSRAVISPYSTDKVLGYLEPLAASAADNLIAQAKQGYQHWHRLPMSERSGCLRNIADAFEAYQFALIDVLIKEAGKTHQDAIDEVREAVDFCRYYAVEADTHGKVMVLPGPTGETNTLELHGRGVFVCISPWNFPLAIFAGQVVAALVMGNAVIAKPAEQTGLIAKYAITIMHECGVPEHALQLAYGDGAEIGQALTAHDDVAGVCFTGSTATANRIAQTLAQKQQIVPLIAETGGQNAMIVEATALPEQVVKDVIASAFRSAGQRCSALRVLYLQEEIADNVITLLKGAMDRLVIGNPEALATDVSAVIDADAQAQLQAHIDALVAQNNVLHHVDVPKTGYFVSPTLAEIDSILDLDKEHFGPILHVVRYARQDIDKVIADVNATGYGLTFGIHSRNETFFEYVTDKIRVGNVYINRNQVGAVVGVQPFGGQGLSGTGPKAGGPHYLLRFVHEKTVTNNITAIGGNTQLLSMG